ncbi:hypothetical protein [Cellulomonas endophytica]|uniref:hypothetical protein n=1 Tax=Cellulomonas endophytica TaxID=2494735 RepID=UPI00196B14E3|nr:hypothetical protein [Cellulomonas endophytica]
MRALVLTRSLTSAAVMLSGVVHLELWAQGMSALDVVGPAFLLNAVAGLVLGVVLQLWEHWLPLLAAAGFGAATLGAFVLSTTVGFFGVQERWQGAAVWLSAVSEVAALVLGLVGAGLVLRRRGTHRAGPGGADPAARVRPAVVRR